VDVVIIQPFDHKHLSVDVPQFRCGGGPAGHGGVNASVENIARVCYENLAPALRRECAAAELRSVTVWETDRTSSTYPG
jgi:6-pyruvoyl-tetrahydropterin synthase